MTPNFLRLQAHILPLSNALSFEQARKEWVLETVFFADSDHCPCGQHIKEQCHLFNKVTGHRTYVGNECVNRFIGIDTGTLFDGLKRLIKNPEANANEAVIAYAESKGYLFEKEPAFLRSIMHKRKLSPAQQSWKAKINRRITNNIEVRREQSHTTV